MPVRGFKEQVQQQTDSRAEHHAEHNGNWDVHEIHHVGTAALCHADKGREQHDHINIVTGRARQYHLRNALPCSPLFFHQLYHSRHNHRRRYRAEHGTHDGRFYPVDAQNVRREQKKRQNLTACRHARHHDRRTSHPLEVGQIERQTGLDQDDDKRHLPQLGRDGQNGIVQPVQHIRAYQNARKQHADDARQTNPAAQCRRSQTEQKCKRE